MDMPTMDTMDTHMLTMDITMARDLLMLSQRPRQMLMLLSSTELMDMLPTHMPMARDLLMLSQRPRLMLMLTLTTDTTDMPTHMPMDTTDMPTTDTTDMPAHTVMLTGDKM